MINNIRNIFKIFDKYQKKNLFILIFLTFISMTLEVLGIASLIPLINFFLKNDLIFYKEYINKISFLNNYSELKIIYLIFIFLSLFFLIKNVYLAFYYWLESKIVYKIRFDLGVKLFKRYINQPYSFHIENNSSNLLTRIIQQAPSFGSVTMSLTNFFSNLILLIGIFVFLFILRPLETTLMLFVVTFLSILFFILTKKKILNIGKETEELEKKRIKLLQESFGAVKEINIHNVQEKFFLFFHKLSDNVAKIGFLQIFFQKLPKIWFETIIVFTTFLLLFYNLFFNFNNEKILITLSIFLISSIKILPAIIIILSSLQNIRFNQNSLIGILKDLNDNKENSYDQKIVKNKNIIFEHEIKFFNVCFHYPNLDNFIIKDCNISIKKNDFICILGETGSGKSTFVDLITSLITPTHGKILVDGVDICDNQYSWKNKISYVPQHPFLLDESIKQNVIFQSNQNYTEEKFIDSLNKAELNSLIDKLPNGVNSIIGEKGIKISGGEKQRISIARAIYKESEIIIFDESTNALDLETEKKIMNTIIKFKNFKTVIFVTHKTNFISIFNRKFRLVSKTFKEE
jgi:ABC-type multidrug transport system fused ATPase/permease subunit